HDLQRFGECAAVEESAKERLQACKRRLRIAAGAPRGEQLEQRSCELAIEGIVGHRIDALPELGDGAARRGERRYVDGDLIEQRLMIGWIEAIDVFVAE